MRRSSNVSMSVDGLRHLTKNVSAICFALSVSCGQLKLRIREELSGLRTVFRAASLVEILLVVSQPVSACSAGRHCVSSSPSALQISWSGNIDLFTPELQISQSSWRPRLLQLTVMWYNRHTKTSVSPDDSVSDVDPVRWLKMSCTWNIILSSASSCVQLSRGNGVDTIHACGDIPRYMYYFIYIKSECLHTSVTL